jgi:molybdopterin-containing oxidoreductase family membrane subunit
MSDTADTTPKPAARNGSSGDRDEELIRGVDAPILDRQLTYESITGRIGGVPLQERHPLVWYVVFGVAFLGVMLLFAAVTWLFAKGVGIWGINIPVAWGFAIINFVWWIGIGHAGTLISAILLLVRQDWRTSINRFAEAMTLFAVACAGLFPILHLGRPWMFYYILPYPNTQGMWPNFRSPLAWDVFAVMTYGTVSLIFWYVGLVPDLATMRDRAKSWWAKATFGFFSLGWRGSAKHWHRYQTAYLLLGGLATPLVISVHSIVGIDFAYSIIPGWHSTIFPPYFVAGAIYSGFAMVLTLVIPIRKIYDLEQMVTMKHVDFMAKVMLATGLLTGYGYLNETFFAWYSASEFELYMIVNRMTGPYGPLYWLLIFCNLISIHVLWFKRVRHTMWMLWIESIIVNVGMWLERYIIVVTSLHRDYLPSSWDIYVPTFWDWAIFIGTIGLFIFLMFLFIRFIPMISMAEMKELLHEETAHEHDEEHEKIMEEASTGTPYTKQQTRS